MKADDDPPGMATVDLCDTGSAVEADNTAQAADTAVTVADSAATRAFNPFPDGRSRIDSATSLWRAAEHGDLGRLKMLLEAGHDVNAMCDDPGWRHKTPLSAAVDGNEPLAVRLLLRRGANPDLQDGDGDRYPLHWASAFGDHDECAELLLQAGASLEARDANGLTPLEFARRPTLNSALGVIRNATSGRPNVEAALIAAGERDATEGARPAWSAEHATRVLKHDYWKAAADGNLKVLERCLTRHRQPVDQPRPASKSRMSALAIAAYNGQLKAMARLIQAGACVDLAEGEGGFTPLHFCVHDADRDDAIELLLEARANPLRAKNDGMTPLDVAKKSKRTASAALLARAVECMRAAETLEGVLKGAAEGHGWLSRVTSDKLAAAIDVAANAEADASLLIRANETLQSLRRQEAVEAGGAEGADPEGGDGRVSRGGTWRLGGLGLINGLAGASSRIAWAQGALTKLVGHAAGTPADDEDDGPLATLRRVRDAAVAPRDVTPPIGVPRSADAAEAALMPAALDEEAPGGGVERIPAESCHEVGSAPPGLGPPPCALEMIEIVPDDGGEEQPSVAAARKAVVATDELSAGPQVEATAVCGDETATLFDAAPEAARVEALADAAMPLSSLGTSDGSHASVVSELSSGEPVFVESVESSAAEEAEHEVNLPPME